MRNAIIRIMIDEKGNIGVMAEGQVTASEMLFAMEFLKHRMMVSKSTGKVAGSTIDDRIQGLKE